MPVIAPTSASPIKSVQRGILAMTNSINGATISAVDTTKSVLTINRRITNPTADEDYSGYARLSPTQVTFNRTSTDNNMTFSWQVTEYF
jgi:hypothetical protein